MADVCNMEEADKHVSQSDKKLTKTNSHKPLADTDTSFNDSAYINDGGGGGESLDSSCKQSQNSVKDGAYGLCNTFHKESDKNYNDSRQNSDINSLPEDTLDCSLSSEKEEFSYRSFMKKDDSGIDIGRSPTSIKELSRPNNKDDDYMPQSIDTEDSDPCGYYDVTMSSTKDSEDEMEIAFKATSKTKRKVRRPRIGSDSDTDSTLLASGSDDLNIVLWNWIRSRPALIYDSGHRSNVFQAKFMPFSGDCHVVSCARDGQIRLAELSLTGVCKGTKKLAQHRGAAHKLALEFDSPHVFLSCGEDALVYEIDLRQEKPNKLSLTKESDRKVPLYSIHSNPSNSYEFCVGGRDHFISTKNSSFLDLLHLIAKFIAHLLNILVINLGHHYVYWNHTDSSTPPHCTPIYTDSSTPPHCTPIYTDSSTPPQCTPIYTDSSTPPHCTPIYTDSSTPPQCTPIYTDSSTPPQCTPMYTDSSTPPQCTPIYTDSSTPPQCTPIYTDSSTPPQYTPIYTDSSTPPQCTPIYTDSSTPTQCTPIYTDSSTPPQCTPIYTDSSTPPQCTPIYTDSSTPPQCTPIIYDKRKIGSEEKETGLIKKYCPHHLVDSDVKANVTCAVYNYNGTEVMGSYNDEDIYLFSNQHSDGAEYIHKYSGHRNNATVKGVNFYGPKSEFVVTGSDCGHIYLWDRESEAVVQFLEGDEGGVINVLEPHPFAPVLATSGLDHDVKIWSPTAEEPTKLKGLKKVLKRNKKERDEERVNEPDMLDGQMLWYIMHQLRRVRRRNEQRGSGDGDDRDANDSSSSDNSDMDSDGMEEMPDRLQCAPS
ncbi:hypothetical protein KUTeg_006068 [Tegillarca granosa]|uniref:Uncharacterized protein n=1 Tax=Tegillarca granosa TaxID=220873 RepID=A0ABQ9FFH1_TEGGR|nr:hypothetical protein KUTeg_006068 [Tegillarca granosa]